MRGERRLAVLLGLVAAACAPTSPRPPSAPPADPALTLFHATCLGCHDSTSPPRPDFARPLDPDTATRALRAVLERYMPPRGSKIRERLGDPERAQIMTWLCRQTGRDDPACERLVRIETAPDLARSGRAILGSFKRGGNPTISDERTELLSGPPGPVWRDARMIANVLLISIDACTLTRPAKAGSALQRCLESFFGKGVKPPRPGAR